MAFTSQPPNSFYQQNSRREFNVRDFGAACDSSALGVGTDDTAAIQAAMNAAQLVNGTVLIPGRCKITAPLTASHSITIQGPGPAPDSHGATSGALGAIGYIPQGQIIKTHTNGDAITFTGNSSNRGYTVRDLGITSATDGQYHTAGAGIRVTNGIFTFIERVTVFHQYDGIVIDGNGTSWETHITDCEIGTIKQNGIKAVRATAGASTGSIYVTGCQISNGNDPSLHPWGAGAGMYFESCVPYVTNSGSIGWAKGIYCGAFVQYGLFSMVGGDTCALPWHFDTSTCICNVVMGGEAYPGLTATKMVSVTGAANLTWIGGQMLHNDTAGVSGFDIDANASYVDIQGVQFYSSSPFGAGATRDTFIGPPLKLASGAHDVRFENNTNTRFISGSAQGVITLGGSHTYCRIRGNLNMGPISGSTAGTGNNISDNT